MSDVRHFLNCHCCLLLKNKYLQLRLTTFLRKAFTVCSYYFVWTDFVHVTLHGSKVAWLCSSPQLTSAHGLFQYSILSLSLIPWRSAFEYCAQVFPCVHIPLKMVPRLHPISFPQIRSFFSFTALTATIVRNPSWMRTFCYMVYPVNMPDPIRILLGSAGQHWPEAGRMILAHRLASGLDPFGQNLTPSARTKSDPGWFCTILSGLSVDDCKRV